MKSYLSLVPSFVAITLSVGLTACGGISETMDSTKQMNKKMDVTNRNMMETNSKIDRTNNTTDNMVTITSNMRDKMGETNSKIDETNKTTKTMADITSGMSDKMGETNKKIDETNQTTLKMAQITGVMSDKMTETNNKMDKTNKAIHNQTLDVALTDLLKPENTKYVNSAPPSPTSMMVPGKIFAEEATADELVQFTYVMLLEINSAVPAESKKDAATGDYTQAVKDQTDDDKNIKFYMLQVVAGMTPQATVEQMIKEQITASGRYEEAAYNFLALRHTFLTTFMLDSSLMGNPLVNPGMYEEALKYTGYVKFIEKLPFVKQVKVSTTGMFSDKRNVKIDLNKADVAKKYYAKLKKSLSQELKPQFRDTKDSKTAERITAIKTEIEAGIAGH